MWYKNVGTSFFRFVTKHMRRANVNVSSLKTYRAALCILKG